jgi:hypothetical protein
MSTLKLRPTFSIRLTQDPNNVIADVRQAVVSNSDELFGRFTSGHAMISLVESKRHFWSPWLNLDVRDSDNGKLLHGRFSPHPSIWTGFMFAYLALAVFSFFSLILGLSQQMASESPWGYGLIPLWMSIALGLWLASQAGQRFAEEEMKMLRQVIEDVVN